MHREEAQCAEAEAASRPEDEVHHEGEAVIEVAAVEEAGSAREAVASAVAERRGAVVSHLEAEASAEGRCMLCFVWSLWSPGTSTRRTKA